MAEEKQTSIRDIERAEASAPLMVYLLKFAPYCVAGGAVAGVLTWLSSDGGIAFLLASIFVYALAGILLGMPIGIFKWWASRRPTDLTAQQQMFVVIGQWPLRVAISAIVSGLLLLGQAINPAPGGTMVTLIGSTLAVFIIFFLVLTAFAFVLRTLNLMPPEMKQDK